MNSLAKATSFAIGIALSVTSARDLTKPTVVFPPEGKRTLPSLSTEGACDPQTLDQMVAKHIPEGQPGHVFENTGWIDQDTGEEHPMQVEDYGDEEILVHTGIILNDGSEYVIKMFKYKPESCFGSNPEKR